MRTHYGRDELLAEHAYERPLVVEAVPCHGGFVGGCYVSPRTLWRGPAIEAWQARLPPGELSAVLDPITARIPPHFPSVAQTKFPVPNDSRAKTLMGWKPAVEWEAAVSRTVSWFSEPLAVDSIVAAS